MALFWEKQSNAYSKKNRQKTGEKKKRADGQ